MLTGLIHRGSGIGDQLFSYIATRVRAADLGVDFGFVGKEFFKGASFMNLDFGKPVGLDYEVQEPSGKVSIFDPNNVIEKFEINTPYYNPEINFISINSIIDGYGAQDIRYFEHRLDEVREWLKVEPLDIVDPDWKGIANIRGGEYRGVPELFLSREYWKLAATKQDYIHSVEWEIHTDDLELAKEWFRDVKAVKDISLNWRSLRYAKYAVISNSAFAIIPRLLAHLDNPKAVTIAPFGWNARNASLSKWLGRPGNYYKKFTYI